MIWRMASTNIRTRSVALAALTVGTFFTAQEVFMDMAGRRGELASQDIVNGLEFWIAWAALTPLVVAAIRRWPLDTPPIAKSIGLHSAVAVSLAALHSIINHVVRVLVDLVFRGSEPLRVSVNGTAVVWDVFTGLVFYAVVVMLFTALALRRLYAAEQVDAEALRAELTQSKLDALRSQLRPHFLFNTLNAISVIVGEDAAKAQQMVLSLSTLLRRALDQEAHEVPLSEELAFTSEYLDIQRARFGSRLDTMIDVPPALLRAVVPVFLLQPLVENAIEHGASEHRPTTVVLHASRDGDTLCVSIADNGPGIPDENLRRDGIGLGNTRARLEQLYEGRSSVTYRAADPAAPFPGARVEIRLPYRETVK